MHGNYNNIIRDEMASSEMRFDKNVTRFPRGFINRIRDGCPFSGVHYRTPNAIISKRRERPRPRSSRRGRRENVLASPASRRVGIKTSAARRSSATLPQDKTPTGLDGTPNRLAPDGHSCALRVSPWRRVAAARSCSRDHNENDERWSAIRKANTFRALRWLY